MLLNRFGLLLVVLMLIVVVTPGHAQEDATQTFTLADGSLQFEYPAGWFAEDHGVWIAVTNNETLLEVNSNGRLQPGDVLIFVFGATETSRLGVETVGSSQAAIESLVSGLSGQLTFGDIQPRDLSGQTATWVTFDNRGSDGAYLAVDVADDLVLTVGAIAIDGDFEDAALTIGRSLAFDASVVTPSRVVQEAVIGPADAPITIYEYGAYGCHACRHWHHEGTTAEIIRLVDEPAFEGKVRFVFINFPVISPFNDPISAEVAQCALDQGQDNFWTFHNAIYDISDDAYAQLRTAEDFIGFAGEQGLDTDALQACMDNRTHRGTVQYNLRRSVNAGVQGTPTFFVNDRQVTQFSEFETFVEMEMVFLDF